MCGARVFAAVPHGSTFIVPPPSRTAKVDTHDKSNRTLLEKVLNCWENSTKKMQLRIRCRIGYSGTDAGGGAPCTATWSRDLGIGPGTDEAVDS